MPASNWWHEGPGEVDLAGFPLSKEEEEEEEEEEEGEEELEGQQQV